ncbi:hypothetical protein CDD83_7266 [Cordyceps sp. RAO-2017]|nr:hypothetical protein CDD83_7266 [Cordyceps sp. RAO-2017]
MKSPGSQLSTYKSLDGLDDFPCLSFLKPLIWQEIRTWVRNDSNTMSVVTHEGLQGPGRLYLGGMNHALNDELLTENAICAVISIHPPDLLAWDEKDSSYGLRRYGSEGCPVQHHLMVPLEDNSNSNLIDYFDNTYHFIRKHLNSGHNILVHCKSGRSRSVAVVIAFLLRKQYETIIKPQGVAADEALKRMDEYRERATDIIRQQRLPVIIIMDRFFELLKIYELQLIGHPNCMRQGGLLNPGPVPLPAQKSEEKVNVKGGAAVLKICIAITFYKNNQTPLKSVVQRLFELDQTYFYELEGSEYKGRCYKQSLHAHRGILRFYTHFAKEYDIAIPPAILYLI